MALTSPLDLEQIFVVDVAGNAEIFTFIATLLVFFILSKFNFPSKVSLSIFALFAVIMAAFLPSIYVIVILVAGITTFYAWTKMVK